MRVITTKYRYSLGIVDEKITGPKAREYEETIVAQEAQMYFSGEQSLEDAIKNIKSRADKLLSE